MMIEKILDEWRPLGQPFRLKITDTGNQEQVPQLWLQEKGERAWRKIVPEMGVFTAVFERFGMVLREAEAKGLLKKEYPTREEAIKEALGKMNPALAAMVDTSNALLVEFSTGVPALWPGGCEPAQEHFANKAMWQAWVAGEGR